jgi:hypothetical protein
MRDAEYLRESLRRGYVAYPGVPEHTRGALERYVVDGLPPGSFLSAVLTNDLVEAVGRADDQNLAALVDIVRLIYNYIPGSSWHSEEAMVEWMKARRAGEPLE